MEIGTNKISKIMEVDMVTLEEKGAKEAVVECKETMMQIELLTTIIVEN